MKLIKTCIACLVIFLAVFSCNKITDIQKLSLSERTLRTKADYNSYLALEYMQFARTLIDSKQEREGKIFAKKGVDVMDGKRFVPESPMKWKADKVQIEEMLLMQKRLEITLNEPQAKDFIPVQLAHLTYLYDCWISRESKAIFRASELGFCKGRFYKLMDEVEFYIEESKRQEKPKVKIKEPEFERFEVLFDVESFILNNEARRGVVEVLEYITTLQEAYRVLVVGNGDRKDLTIADKNLAFKRAEVVREYLIKNGVESSMVQLRSVGEDFPDIISKTGEKSQSNRKVGVYILKGANSFFDTPFSLIKNDIYKKGIQEARKARGL